jgi:radical SAM superfamily enzyme YgiQ (UPF0313 family)
LQFIDFLLIYPEIPETYWSYKHALPFVGKKALMPPLGLLTIAAMIPERYSVRLVDMNVEELGDDDIMAAGMVCISAMIVQKDSFQELLARCRRLGVPVTAGGPYPTSCSEEIEGVDHFVLNEGECTFPAFLDDYAKGTLKPRYESAVKPVMDRVPVPRFDLSDMSVYDTMPLQYSRGCPFDCEFCDIVQLFGRKTRTKGPRQFIRELDSITASGFKGTVFIVDDNFIGNKRKVKELLRELITYQKENGYPFNFSTEASINLAEDEELMDLMAAAKFRMVFIGIESPVAESLSGAGKQQNLRKDISESIRSIQAKGIEVTGGFIIGFDTDPVDIFDLQIAFIKELAVPVAMIGTLMALPNTRLYERMKAEGRMLSQSNGNNTHDSMLNFVTRLPMETILKGYTRVLSEVYMPRAYFDRCRELFKRFPPPSAVKKKEDRSRISFSDIKAFFKSIIRQTFSFYGMEYLRYLIGMILRRPGYLVKIVTLAVQGHHFLTMTEERRRQKLKAASPRYAERNLPRTIGLSYENKIL